jgi:hypothetical protein
MWGTTTYHDWYAAYVTHAVADEGRLGPAYVEMFDEGDYGQVAVDAASDVFYKQTLEGGLRALAVELDGRLTGMGASNLCLASTVSYADPLVAVGGFLFASSDWEGPGTARGRTVCSWEGPRLATRANIGVDSDYAVSVSPQGVSSAPSTAAIRPATFVAMRTSYSVKHGTYYQTKYEVRLFAVRDDGGLELLDTVEPEPGYANPMLFHPSGRFLYVSHAASYAAPPG